MSNPALGLLNGVILALIIFRVVIVGSVIGTADVVSSFDQKITMAQLEYPKTILKLALLDDEEFYSPKRVAENFKEIQSLSPHELAISSVPLEMTSSDIKQLQTVLQSDEGVATGDALNSLFIKCQGWMTKSAPGTSEFDPSERYIADYYEGLISTGGLNLLNPTSLSEFLHENIDALKPIFVNDGLNAKTCGKCFELKEDYALAFKARQMITPEDNVKTHIEIRREMHDLGCAEVCAQVCVDIYPTLKAINFDAFNNPELSKALISKKIQVS